MAGSQDIVFECIEDPDAIVHRGLNELIAVKHYGKTAISEKDVIVT
jgi:hypothetical protein